MQAPRSLSSSIKCVLLVPRILLFSVSAGPSAQRACSMQCLAAFLRCSSQPALYAVCAFSAGPSAQRACSMQCLAAFLRCSSQPALYAVPVLRRTAASSTWQRLRCSSQPALYAVYAFPFPAGPSA
eukprot:1160961-Pelagomonas_calceolata.AAC.11